MLVADACVLACLFARLLARSLARLLAFVFAFVCLQSLACYGHWRSLFGFVRKDASPEEDKQPLRVTSSGFLFGVDAGKFGRSDLHSSSRRAGPPCVRQGQRQGLHYPPVLLPRVVAQLDVTAVDVEVSPLALREVYADARVQVRVWAFHRPRLALGVEPLI